LGQIIEHCLQTNTDRGLQKSFIAENTTITRICIVIRFRSLQMKKITFETATDTLG